MSSRLSTSILIGLRDGMPSLDALQRIGEMDQATAVFDDKDQLAFTIFKEQRIEVPLSDVSPNLTKAITSMANLNLKNNQSKQSRFSNFLKLSFFSLNRMLYLK